MEPDAVTAEGFPSAVMATTLTASGVYQKVSPEEIRALVDFLSEKKGN